MLKGDAAAFAVNYEAGAKVLMTNMPIIVGKDEIVKAVRTTLKQRADFIKILATGAVLSKGIPPGAQQYSDAEIAAAVTARERLEPEVSSR